MKKFLLLFCFSVSAFAADVGLEFRAVGVVDLAEGVIRGILHKDYVIAPDVMANSAKLTMSVRSMEKEKVFPMLEAVLKASGVDIEERAGVYYIEARKPDTPQANPVTGPNPFANNPGQMSGAMPGQLSAQYPGQFAGQFPGQFGMQQPHIVPKEVAFHRPRGKSLEFLASIAKLAGAYVPDIKQKGDVLVFGGDEKTVERAKKLLDEIDTPKVSLLVRAALVEYTEGDSSSRSLSLALSALAGKLGLVYQAGSALTNSASYKGNTLQAALSVIDGDQRFKYVAEPSLRVMDGETAKFVVGSEVPTRSGVTVDKNGNPVQSVEYRTAGVVITVQPNIFRDSVQLKIGQQISSFALTTTSGIDSPTILKREAETTVSAEDGELIVIGGMDETRESDSRGGLSFLPDFLRSTDRNKTRSQLLLMLEVKRQAVAI